MVTASQGFTNECVLYCTKLVVWKGTPIRDIFVSKVARVWLYMVEFELALLSHQVKPDTGMSKEQPWVYPSV